MVSLAQSLPGEIIEHISHHQTYYDLFNFGLVNRHTFSQVLYPLKKRKPTVEKYRSVVFEFHGARLERNNLTGQKEHVYYDEWDYSEEFPDLSRSILDKQRYCTRYACYTTFSRILGS
jgi:hypothetical protein